VAASIDKTISRAGLDRDARLYALRQLALRAGVQVQDFASWRIEIESRETRVCPQPGKTICFPHAGPEVWEKLIEGRGDELPTANFDWMFAPEAALRNAIASFVVPYSSCSGEESAPLFMATDENRVVCQTDLLLSLLLVLSRAEEMSAVTRDQHGRFPGSASRAYREEFLDRPIVDEYGMALEQVLTHLMPAWRPRPRTLRVKVSHDIDLVGIPFELRPTIGHTLLRRRPLATARDLIAGVAHLQPTCLGLVKEVVSRAQRFGLRSAVYWKAAARGPYDSGYDPRHPQIRQVISWLNDQGMENGVHPGYETFSDPARLRSEVSILREVLPEDSLGGRQHYLRWSPRAWLDWEQCGLAYDSTVGYADCTGFRAGTCYPYRPWLLAQNREADLLEIPLIVMEGAAVVRMRLSPDQAFDLIRADIQRCRLVGGVFTLLWHNASLIEPRYGNLYDRVLQELSGCENFDWRQAEDLRHAGMALPACS
jgi:hypothetical protein